MQLQIRRVFYYDYFKEYSKKLDVLKSEKKIENNVIVEVVKTLVQCEKDYHEIRKLKKGLLLHKNNQKEK